MMRKLFLLLVIVAVVWFGARALVHRGEVKATVVFDHARDLRNGDPVVADGTQIGVVTKVTHLDDTDAVSIRIDRDHRRDVVSDSFFAIDHHLGTMKSRVAKIEDDLRRSNRAEEARKVKEKFEKWLDEVQR
jgi:preprotein translocase subunit YajC